MNRILQFVVLACLSQALALRAQSELPEGKAKPLVERTCSKCHDLAGTTSSRNTRERWANVVDDMVSRGAELTDAQMAEVVDYLSTNFGPNRVVRKINVNKVTATELASATGLTARDAEAVVNHREKNGAFKQWQDLEKVSGIDMKKLEATKDRLEY